MTSRHITLRGFTCGAAQVYVYWCHITRPSRLSRVPFWNALPQPKLASLFPLASLNLRQLTPSWSDITAPQKKAGGCRECCCGSLLCFFRWTASQKRMPWKGAAYLVPLHVIFPQTRLSLPQRRHSWKQRCIHGTERMLVNRSITMFLKPLADSWTGKTQGKKRDT